jgi:hypothetical protein
MAPARRISSAKATLVCQREPPRSPASLGDPAASNGTEEDQRHRRIPVAPHETSGIGGAASKPAHRTDHLRRCSPRGDMGAHDDHGFPWTVWAALGREGWPSVDRGTAVVPKNPLATHGRAKHMGENRPTSSALVCLRPPGADVVRARGVRSMRQKRHHRVTSS